MREIKFRAWDNVNKIMTEPFNILDIITTEDFQFDCTNGEYFRKNDICATEWCIDMIFLEFTGLKDKNDEEIYEGDIIEYTIHMVRSNEQIYPCKRMLIKWEFEVLYQLNNIVNMLRSVKIIGNIHESPGLLEE